MSPTSKQPVQHSHDALIHFLKQHPHHQHLIEQAKEAGNRDVLITQNRFRVFSDLFFANPKNFHGNAHVNKELYEHSKLTATMANISSWTDFITNWPFLFFFMKDLGPIVGLFSSFLINIALLKFSNDCASGTSGRTMWNQNWSRMATIGLISINILQSLASSIGVELINNKTGLAEMKADELIDDQFKRIAGLKQLSSPDYETADKDCKEGETILNSMKRDHPRWDSLYNKLYGSWSQRGMDWKSIQPENRPVCIQRDILALESTSRYTKAKAEWETLRQESIHLNNLAFLKLKLPNIYSQYFDHNGELLSGIESVGFASRNFFYKLGMGDWHGISGSLFFFGFSCITSFAACSMAITHARRQDTKLSRSEKVAGERDRWLQELYESMVDDHQQNLN